MKKILAITNQKGGVGKTTTSVNLAAGLAKQGRTVCLIDLDPQGHASLHLGVDAFGQTPTVYDVFSGKKTLAEVKQLAVDNLWVIPSDLDLAATEIELVDAPGRELILRGAIERLVQSQPIDYIIMDCPPSLGLLTINAFAASKELLIPIQTEYYALEGLSQLLETYSVVKKRLNPNLNLSTIVLTMFDSRTRLSNDVAANVRSHFPNELIDIPIPRAVRVSEAPSYNQTVMTYDPLSPGAIAYMQVAREITERGKAKDEVIFDGNVVSINYKGGIA